MKNIVLLTGSSLITVAVGLATAKLFAFLIGPTGFGQLALVQGVVGLVALIAELGLGNVVIRDGARLLAERSDNENRNFKKFYREVATLALAMAAVCGLSMVVLRNGVSSIFLGAGSADGQIVWCALALCFAISANLRMAALNAHQAMAAIAAINVLSGVLSATVSIGLVWAHGERAIAPATALGALVRWTVTVGFSWSTIGFGFALPRWEAARRALSKGLPIALSSLVGVGIQYLLPSLLIPSLGKLKLGFVQAAMSITAGVLGAIAVALGQDYLPRISSLRTKPDLHRAIDEQMKVALIFSLPVILVVKALAPFVIPILLSESFLPAVPALTWLLAAEVIRFASLSLAYAVMAQLSGRSFLLAQVVPAAASILFLTTIPNRLGVEGVGMAMICSNAVAFGVLVFIAQRSLSYSLRGPQWCLLICGLLFTIGPSLLPGVWAHLASAGVAITATIWSGNHILRSRFWQRLVVARSPEIPSADA